MKKVLIVVMTLALSLAFYAGNAEAVNGIADKVPGTDVAIPFFCDEDGAGENTVWAIASTAAQEAGYIVYTADDSDVVYDDTETFTENDIESWDCVSLINTIGITGKNLLCSGGECIGYIVYTAASGGNTLMGWSYMMDTSLGFSASGISLELENGSINLSENGILSPILANQMFPRWFLLNDNSETKTNWIFLTGDDLAGSNIILTGVICDEDENCPSLPDTDLGEVTVIDASNLVPQSWLPVNNAGAEASGWAILNVSNPNSATIVGISHQKAQAANLLQTWDVSHTIHRTISNGSYTHVN